MLFESIRLNVFGARKVFYLLDLGIGKARLRTAALMEEAKCSGQAHLLLLLDLMKCFELVAHHHLVRKAHAKGYPLHALRLSLAAYRLRRTVGADGLYANLVVAVLSFISSVTTITMAGYRNRSEMIIEEDDLELTIVYETDDIIKTALLHSLRRAKLLRTISNALHRVSTTNILKKR